VGGCTISFIRDTREEALEACKAQIIKSVELGLWPDSELVILQNEAEEAELYQVLFHVEELGPVPKGVSVSLARVSTGRAFHVGVAAKFTRAMKPGEWIASVHVHT